MVLILLVILAVLIWAIQNEIDRSTEEKVQVVGKCISCNAVVEPDWLVCPHCRERLSESCTNCHRGKLMSQPHCPHCGVASKGLA